MQSSAPRRANQRGPQTPRRYWAAQATGLRPPGMGFWLRLLAAWAVWAAAAFFQQPLWFWLGFWLIPLHRLTLGTVWALRRSPPKVIVGWWLRWMLLWLGTGLAGALAGRFLDLPLWPGVEQAGWPWNVLATWLVSLLLIGLGPWWWEGFPLVGLLLTWSAALPAWLLGLALVREASTPALQALLMLVAGGPGTWALWGMALALVGLGPASLGRRLLLALLGLPALLAWWGFWALAVGGTPPPRAAARPT